MSTDYNNLRLTLKGVCAENWSHIVHRRRSSCCVIHFRDLITISINFTAQSSLITDGIITSFHYTTLTWNLIKDCFYTYFFRDFTLIFEQTQIVNYPIGHQRKTTATLASKLPMFDISESITKSLAATLFWTLHSCYNSVSLHLFAPLPLFIYW